jgi:hypothetical protein
MLPMLAGCEDDTGGDAASTGGQGGAGGEAAGGASGADTYAAGMTRAGVDARLSLTLLDAVPAPPQRELNDWRVRVEDPSGVAVSGCTLGVGLFMPVHGHSSTTEPVITPAEAAGEYRIDDMNFFMPGLWEITFDLTCGAVTDQVQFAFEIAR